MKKKLLSMSLITLILISSIFGSVKPAEAALPDAVIKLSKPLLARLITLVVAGLNLESVTSAEDIAGRYYESGLTAPSWDAEGNLTIDVQAIDNARNWLDTVYPGLPATIEVDGGLSYIGQTLPAMTDYTPNSTPRTLFHDHDFSATGLYQINILNFGSITTWMDYNPNPNPDPDPDPVYNFPALPSTFYNKYFIVGSTDHRCPPEEPLFLYMYKDDDVLNHIYQSSSNTITSTTLETFQSYYYNLAQNRWLSGSSAATTVVMSTFNGIIYESNVDIYSDSSLTTKLYPPTTTPSYETNDCVMSLSDGETMDYYDLDLSMYSAFASWGYPGGSTNVVYPYSDYLGLYNQMRWNISSNPSLSEPGKQDLTVWPSFHDLSAGWTDFDQMPNFTFEGTSGTNINLSIDAYPMDTIQAQMQYYGSYPKTDLILGPKATETVITGQPINWNQINTIVENPVDPTTEPPIEEPPGEEVGLLTSILALFNALLTWLQSLPNLISEAIGTKLMALFVPLDLTPIKEDFEEVNEAFANAFPFSIAADLHGLFFPPDGGLQYPCIGYTMTDPDQVSRYHVVFDFGDIPSGHRAMSDKLRHILTLGLWLGFAVGILSMALKRGGKIS